MAQSARMQSEWGQGWRPLLAGFTGMMVGWNVAAIAAGLFLKPMQAEFGWSRTDVSFGPIASLIVALLLPVVGLLIDRIGARLVAIIGVTSLSSAWALLSVIPARHDAFWAAVVWLGIAGGISNSVVFARGVTPWFKKNLGLAIGMMMTGASLGPAIGIPWLGSVIAEDGWRAGFRALAVVTLAFGLPFVLAWFREPDASNRSAIHGDARPERLRDIAARAEFWKLTLACAVAALPIGGFVGHLVPLLTDQGLELTVAAGFASSFAVAVGIGRVFNGFMLDRFHPPAVVFVTLALASIGVLSMILIGISALSWAAIAAVVGLIGLAQGAEGDYIKFFSIKLFGMPNFARVVPLMAMNISIFMATGGIIFSLIYDKFGSYTPALYASAALYFLGGLCFLAIRMKAAVAR